MEEEISLRNFIIYTWNAVTILICIAMIIKTFILNKTEAFQKWKAPNVLKNIWSSPCIEGAPNIFLHLHSLHWYPCPLLFIVRYLCIFHSSNCLK